VAKHVVLHADRGWLPKCYVLAAEPRGIDPFDVRMRSLVFGPRTKFFVLRPWLSAIGQERSHAARAHLLAERVLSIDIPWSLFGGATNVHWGSGSRCLRQRAAHRKRTTGCGSTHRHPVSRHFAENHTDLLPRCTARTRLGRGPKLDHRKAQRRRLRGARARRNWYR